MNEELRDQVAGLLAVLGNTPMSKAECYATADAIIAILARLRVKEQRDAFCAGAGWAAASVAMEEWRGTIPEPVTDVASRRYPEVEVKP